MATPSPDDGFEIQGDVGGSHRGSKKKKITETLISEAEQAALEKIKKKKEILNGLLDQESENIIKGLSMKTDDV